MMKPYSIFFFVIVAALLLVSSTAPAQVNVSVSVDRTRIGLNEEFFLVVEITGSGGDPRLPEMNAFAGVTGSSSSTSIQMTNGRISQSVTYQYSLVAQTAGKFTIGAVEVEAKGQVYRSQPIEIEIVAGSTTQPSQGQPGGAGRGQQPEAPPDLEGSLYLEAKVDRSRVYQNEPVVVRYRIYTRLNISSYGIASLPNYNGFWTEDFPAQQQPQTRREVINGQTYLVAEIKKTALFPQSVGKKKLEPLTIECEVQMPRRRSRDIFDQFFDDPFLSRTSRQRISSRPVEIDVLPLPEEGKPAYYSGAVGNFTITANVDKTQIKANEAISLKVRVNGVGNIKVLPNPPIALPSDFEVYDPKVAENIDHTNDQISGSKTWEYVIVPRFQGNHEIKPITLSYFDPRTKTYKTTATAPILLTVEKGTGDFSPVTGGGVSKEDVRLLGQDIRFIATAPLPLVKTNEKFYTGPWFLLLLTLPVGALLAALVYQRHQEKLSTNVAYARSRKAGGVAQKQLALARKYLQRSEEKNFYAEIQRALLGFLGNKLNIAEAGLITDEVEHQLTEKKVSPEIIREYLNCLQTCDFVRFAPAASNGKAMQEFYEQSRRALEALEKVL